MPTFSLKPLIAILLITGLSSAASAAMPAATPQAAVTAPGSIITGSRPAVISSTAVQALRHIVQARTDLAALEQATRQQERRERREAAQSELDQAKALLNAIEDMLPTATAKDWLWIAEKRLDYKDTSAVVPDLAPVYQELTRLEDDLPVEDSRQQLDKAKQALEKGDKQAAIEALEAAQEALVYPEIDLPLAATRQLVTTAQADLASGHIQTADERLGSAEDSATKLSMVMPLVQARRSLRQAAQNFAAGAYEAARMDITRAINDLQNAAEKGDEKTRQDMQFLLTQTQQQQASLAEKQTGFVQELTHLWQRVETLSERLAEQMSAEWTELRQRDNPAKEYLSEAKLHLGYARTDQLVANSLAGAKLQLEEAQRYLNLAVKEASDNDKASVNEVQQDLNQLIAAANKATEQDAQALQAQYDALLAKLRRLVRGMEPQPAQPVEKNQVKAKTSGGN